MKYEVIAIARHDKNLSTVIDSFTYYKDAKAFAVGLLKEADIAGYIPNRISSKRILENYTLASFGKVYKECFLVVKKG